MAVSVTLFPLLAKRATSRRERFETPFVAGMKPADIIRGEGFNDTDTEAIMVLVNDIQVELDTPVKDGDRLEFMIAIAGGTY